MIDRTGIALLGAIAMAAAGVRRLTPRAVNMHNLFMEWSV